MTVLIGSAANLDGIDYVLDWPGQFSILSCEHLQ